MHPPLFRPHHKCSEIADALAQCHVDCKWSKFWGACNDTKRELDLCFRLEKEESRQKNMQKGRLIEEIFQRKLAEAEMLRSAEKR